MTETAPADGMRPIPNFTDYAITRTGEVYRVTPTRQRGVRFPRPVRVEMGTNGRTDRKVASVRLVAPNGAQKRRGLAKLMREVWPEVGR